MIKSMRHFIFLTQEGYTFQPNSESDVPDIENMQVLGVATGEDANAAFNRFIKENEYLLNTDFDQVLAMELKDRSTYNFSLKRLEEN